MDYQKDQPDCFHHQYVYDADNRITEVKSSADGADWHRDARYFYYPHGPLERVELGEHLVQGTDYAYTLQGWLKGINGDRLNPNTDMGRDGDPTVTSNPNLLAGRDAFSMSLGYYGDTDYKAIGNVWNTVTERPFAPIGTSGTLHDAHYALYNGNIAHTVNTLQPFGLWDAGNGNQGQVLGQVFRYDQMNRLKKARGVEGLTSTNTWNTVTDAATNKYRSEYEYDANGNITTAKRYDADENHYDEFSYKYEKRGNRVVRNRLYQLNDLADEDDDWVNEAGGAKDIGWTGDVAFDEEDEDMNDDYNYGYDALGNLVRDTREHIANIEWTVAGKVKRVVHETGEGPGIEFAYGASGQRTLKQVSDPDMDATGYREHYIRDAQGNIMATYRYTNDVAASLKLNERPLYGSSRLGSLRKEEELHSLPSFDSEEPNPVQQVDLNYELTDHLGNVCAVVTGRLLDGNGGGTPKQAELLSAQGYEPFGTLLPGRNYSSDAYRFGFNGMPKDDEVYGATGTSYDFGARLNDPRLGRWWSIDAYNDKYPDASPYAFASNNPIFWIDRDGNEIVPSKAFQQNAKATKVFGQLNQTGTFMATTKKFDGPRPIVHLYLDVQDFGPRPNANTAGRGSSSNPYPFSIAITLNASYLEKASDIAIARTILHESIHAKIYRMIESGGGKVSEKSFPGILDYYNRHKDAKRGWQHEVMAQHYRGEVIQGLKEFDALNGVEDRSGAVLVGESSVNYTSDQFYEAMSWGGLHNTTAWNRLTGEQRSLYRSIINKEAGGRDMEFTIELPEMIITAPKEK